MLKINTTCVISTLHTQSIPIFTPPTTSPTTTTSQSTSASDVKLLTCKSNQFVDESVDNIHLLLSGSPKVKPFFPFDLTTSYDAYEHGGSAYFDGDGDYLNYEQSTRDTYDADFTTEVGYIQYQIIF